MTGSRASFSRKPPSNGASSSAPSHRATLLPVQIGIRRFGFQLNRRKCEDGLVLCAVCLGAWKLARQWEERALAGGELIPGSADPEICLLMGLSVVYKIRRTRSGHTPTPMISPPLRQNSSSAALHPHTGGYQRDKSSPRLASMTLSGTSSGFGATREEKRSPGLPTLPEEEAVLGDRGCVWGTEERQYRCAHARRH